MKTISTQHQRNLHRALVIGYVAATALSLAIVGLVLWGLSSLKLSWLSSGVAVALAIVLGLAVSGLLAILALTQIMRRLDRLDDVTAAWLRGNLGLRIADARPDEIGAFSGRLDLLAEQLEQDEQDLDTLRQSNSRLTDQVRALAVVEERNRLARELHDSVKQHLFSVAMTASAIRARLRTVETTPTDVSEMVEDIEAAAHHAQQETTRLIEDLRPGSLHEQGLEAALNDYTLLFGAQEHLLVYLDVACDDRRLPPSVREALYRVAQEALHNVARHAHATRVDVRLTCEGDRVALTVRDDGVGFDTASANKGLGIGNMQERLMALGGRLDIESQPGVGTEVIAEVDLHPTDNNRGEDYARTQGARFDDWAWLGERLVIPVGQIWPWLPVDEQNYLHDPLLRPESTPVAIQQERRGLGMAARYSLRPSEQSMPVVRFHHEGTGYTWTADHAAWELRRIRGGQGRMVLYRNGQALAAVQYRGRQMAIRTEIVYNSRSYVLAYDQEKPGIYLLTDETGGLIVEIDRRTELINIHSAIPLPLLVIVTVRCIDEVTAMRVDASALKAKRAES